MPVKFCTVDFEKSGKHLYVPHFFAISKARVPDKNAQNGLTHHLATVSGRMFSPLPVTGDQTPPLGNGKKFPPRHRGAGSFVCFVEKTASTKTRFS